MTTNFFCPQLFDGEIWHSSAIIKVVDGNIISVKHGHIHEADIVLEGTVAPGLIDLQVNGGGGLLFNQHPSVNTIITMRNAHAVYGTSAMLPTVITDSYATMNNCADAISEALALRVEGIIGVHFEGPHIDNIKRGIHPENHIRGLTDKEIDLFCRRDLGHVLVTLAPESATEEQIRYLVKNDVTVSLGHSNANFADVKKAIGAGATGFTHLFNAMSGISAREPGMAGCALTQEHTFASIIADHFHVHDSMCELAIKVIGPERLLLVTDSMSHVGADASHVLDFNNQVISKDNGKLTTPDGVLAGSALDLMGAVSNVHLGLNQPLENALRMASETPAKFMRVNDSIGKVKPGYMATFIAFDSRFGITANYFAGHSLI